MMQRSSWRMTVIGPGLALLMVAVVGCSGQAPGTAASYCAPSCAAPCPSPCAPPAGALIAGVQDVERPFDTEAYDSIDENAFRRTDVEPVSTFAIDVDTASYSNVRRFLTEGRLPPAGAVRIEELVNYFPYADPAPGDGSPFHVRLEAAACPWAPEHRLVRIGMKGREFAQAERPPANLVFLLDVSGSMQPANKLPLVKRSLRALTEQLGAQDRVAIVVYAGASGLVLPSTAGSDQAAIHGALERLEAGGSTNGASGIQLAYDTAAKAFIRGGTNRVILATDGDFNVGITDESSLVALIRRQAARGVFLTVLGFGMGNLKDSTLEKLADRGNGNYGYVDTPAEAEKLLVAQAGGTLHTIAKDVKIQVEFNPARVAAWRLLGYENRLLAREDFNDDAKDGGEIGAGHTVTALYEVVPVGANTATASVDPLRYQQTVPVAAVPSAEMLHVKVRYKQPDGDTSSLLAFPLTDTGGAFAAASDDLRFSASVAAFGMLLRDSPHKGGATWGMVETQARAAIGRDVGGYRAEFLDLTRRAAALDDQRGGGR